MSTVQLPAPTCIWSEPPVTGDVSAVKLLLRALAAVAREETSTV